MKAVYHSQPILHTKHEYVQKLQYSTPTLFFVIWCRGTLGSLDHVRFASSAETDALTRAGVRLRGSTFICVVHPKIGPPDH